MTAHACWLQFDANDSGRIDRSELAAAMKKVSFSNTRPGSKEDCIWLLYLIGYPQHLSTTVL